VLLKRNWERNWATSVYVLCLTLLILQRQMFMELLMGHAGGAMRVRAVWPDGKQKINAIKAVRSVTRFGLKEAKDVVDAADNHISVIDGNWSTVDYNQLKRELINTGYELL